MTRFHAECRLAETDFPPDFVFFFGNDLSVRVQVSAFRFVGDNQPTRHALVGRPYRARMVCGSTGVVELGGTS